MIGGLPVRKIDFVAKLGILLNISVNLRRLKYLPFVKCRYKVFNGG